jgi:predicted ArsR family transcriptional regulator
MSYPHEPGWKEGDTSREAAESMSLRAITLRKLSYDFIRSYPEHTADEIAMALDESVLTIRPRISELRKMQFVRNHGRGLNRSGKPAHRWVVCDDVSVTSDEINARFMALWPRKIETLRQVRHRYVAALNAVMDKIEDGDKDAARELKAELDEMQLLLDQSYEWVS